MDDSGNADWPEKPEDGDGGFSHFDPEGRPRMVDIGGKARTSRRAVAECLMSLPGRVSEALLARGAVAKGDPLSVAELGGIMGAKRTPELIPLAHPIKLEHVSVRCELSRDGKTLRIECEASAGDSTGVEMEAMTGAATAALVFYDMCKGLDKGMEISRVRLLEKSGGKSGLWKAENN